MVGTDARFRGVFRGARGVSRGRKGTPSAETASRPGTRPRQAPQLSSVSAMVINRPESICSPQSEFFRGVVSLHEVKKKCMLVLCCPWGMAIMGAIPSILATDATTHRFAAVQLCLVPSPLAAFLSTGSVATGYERLPLATQCPPEILLSEVREEGSESREVC